MLSNLYSRKEELLVTSSFNKHIALNKKLKKGETSQEDLEAGPLFKDFNLVFKYSFVLNSL